jgi:hypothetical protein
MPFNEDLKLTIRKKSHFRCCLCHNLGVEIHHIIPQAENGADTEDNAAPLCPSCHETYGANSTKRKFIKDARNFWYELCSKRYVTDPEALSQITEKLDNTASKSDLESITVTIAKLLEKKTRYNGLTSVELPDKYWVVLLGALEPTMETVTKKIEELKAEGYSLDNLDGIPEELVTSIIGMLIGRGSIVDALVTNGVMRPEASKLGAKHIMQSTNKVVEQFRKKKKNRTKKR